MEKTKRQLSMKPQSAQHMKLVVEALRKGKQSWSELKKLGSGIPEKSLERVLKDYLEPCGLVRNEGDGWTWFENARVFTSKEEYDLAIHHSKELLPVFSGRLQCSSAYQNLTAAYSALYSAAVEHLKSYPDTYRKWKEYDETQSKMRSKVLENRKVLPNSFDPDQITPLNAANVCRNWAPTHKSETKLKDEIEKEAKSFEESYKKLAGDISFLTLKVEHGQPLEGTCGLCPKVKIS